MGSSDHNHACPAGSMNRQGFFAGKARHTNESTGMIRTGHQELQVKGRSEK